MTTCKIVKWRCRQRGMSAARPPRPIYGWTWLCSCGRELKTNETKRDARKQWRAHRDTRDRYAEELRHVLDPILTGIIHFRVARNRMRSDNRIGNVVKQWAAMNDAKGEWETAISFLTEIESALDDFRDSDGTLMAHDAQTMEDFLDRISEYI